MSDLVEFLPGGDSGEFRVPMNALASASSRVLDEAEEALLAHLRANPGLQMEVWDDWDRREKVLRWGPRRP